MAKYYSNLLEKTPVTRFTRAVVYRDDGSVYDQTQEFASGNIEGRATRLGTSLTGWREKIARGENATTAFTGLKQRVEVEETCDYDAKEMLTGGWYVLHTYRTSNGGIPWVIPTHPFSNADIAAIGNQALAKFLKRFRSRTTAFQGLVFGGELRETLRMLRSPLKGIVQTLESYFTAVYQRNGRYKKRDRIKRSSDLWLEYSFGLGPLVSDLRDAVKAYNAIGTMDPREVISAYSEQDTVAISEINGGPAGGIGPWIDLQTDSFICRVRYMAGLKIDLDMPPSDQELMRFGLTTQHIAAALWELTPWSFLFDYFSNIGDVIEAGFTDTSRMTWGCKTVRIDGHRLITRRLDETKFYKQYRPGSTVSWNPGIIRLFSKSIERSSIGSLVPDLAFEVPGLGVKWLNMAALTASRNRALLSF